MREYEVLRYRNIINDFLNLGVNYNNRSKIKYELYSIL